MFLLQLRGAFRAARASIDVVSGPDSDVIKEAKNEERKDKTPMIYICGTMWHETETEMVQMLKSLFRYVLYCVIEVVYCYS